MKLLQFKFWQWLALLSGSIIAIVMALASISYNAALGTDETAFALLPVSNRFLFQALALAFDLGMIASVFGFWHWLRVNLLAAGICVILFVIASLFSIHSVRGYIALNVTKSLAPMEQSRDIYASLKRELRDAQSHLSALQRAMIKAKGRERKRISRRIDAQRLRITAMRSRLTGIKPVAHASPLRGLDWFLALTLWLFHATCWTAWFGSNMHRLIWSSKMELQDHKDALPQNQNSVGLWLSTYRQSKPEHCVKLYDHYQSWCAAKGYAALAKRKFYAMLITMGARKFRDGRNGPMLYELPKNDKLGEI